MRKNAPGDQSMLERNSALHVRAAVVYALGDGKQLVVHGASSLIVLSLAGIDHLKQKLRCNVAVADQHAVDVKCRVQEILIVAGQDLEVRALLADDRDLSVPAAHVAHAVLHREHAGLGRDVEHGLQVVGCVCVVGVLEKDQRQAGGLVDNLVPVLRRAGLVAEAKPAVGWVEKTGFGACGFGALGLKGGDFGALAGDAGDDGDAVVDGLDEGSDDFFLFGLGEESTLAGVAKDY